MKNVRGWRLVHGFALVGGMARDGLAIPGEHAWLQLPDGRVWDPTENALATAEEYAAACHAMPVREYTKLQAARLASRHGHYGPWYDDKTGSQAERRFWQQHVPGFAEVVGGAAE
jgi:hypothetical protein